jgi:Transglycosylase SLT domain
MRKKQLLSLALAALGATVIAGSYGSGDDSVALARQADPALPGRDDLPEPAPLPACSNAEDDDGDGLVDVADPDCSDPNDPIEAPDADDGDDGGGGGGGGDGGTEPPPPPPDDGGTEPPPPPPDDGGDDEDEGDEDGTTGPGGGGGRGGGQRPDPPPDDTNGGNANDGSGGTDPSGDRGEGHSHDQQEPMPEQPTRRPDGVPTNHNPSLTIADAEPAPLGVPNFIIDSFSIPPFLLEIYQACGTEYGIPWQILASINRIETAFGTNLNVSTAGAVGWMQFLPSSWRAYGVDRNGDGRKDPYNPYDAICAAARYLRAAGAEQDMRAAIFAYNHADWYVDEVLFYANQYERLPDDLVSGLGALSSARFPVAADARYADDLSEREALERAEPSQLASGNAADVVSSSPTRRGINIYSREGAKVIAVNDGVIKKLGHSKRLGNFVVLEDAYGNRFTYAQLGRISEFHPVPEQERLTAKDFELVSPDRDDEPDAPASKGTNRDLGSGGDGDDSASSEAAGATDGPVNTEDLRERLYAYPERRNNLGRADLTGQLDDLLAERFPGYESFKSYLGGVLEFDEKSMELRPLHEGSRVVSGTVLGRVGKTDELAPHLHFAIRPAGRGAPRIDPKPILDGWKLLEATAIYRAAGEDPFEDTGATVSQILLMSKEQLERRVLADHRLEIYSCGRTDIRTGQIDRRVMALLEYLAERGFRLTITSLKCGHSVYTASGNISEHSVGGAVDIAAINGQPILGNQGPGTLAYALVRDVLRLQGTMEPHQVISLMDFGGPSFAMADHADHVHVGYDAGGESNESEQFIRILRPSQWERLIDRIAEIDNPDVRSAPSRFAIPAGKRKRTGPASSAHVGE